MKRVVAVGIPMRAVLSFFLVLLAADAADAAKSAESIKVTHTPKLPKTGERVVVSVEAPSPLRIEGWQLQYQVVEPGDYVELQDPAYTNRWTSLTLAKAKAKAALTAELPADLQKHRRLIRYRVYSPAAKVVVAPAPDDAQRNFAYFVYDGIPAWQGAINPKGSEQERTAVRFDPQVMRSVQSYHLIGKQESVENATWHERSQGSEYKYTGTMVVDGKVYDHVRFRARGGAWRYAMGKNMWKIDFLKGHHLEARDNWGQKYPVKWGKLNLGACIQQGDYGMRGEHGLLEAVSYRLFNLARVAAPQTHWVQLRIIDSTEENPADQYRGDYWGLYLAVENVDEDFLQAHGLPDGSLYKMDFGGPEPQRNAQGVLADRGAALKFMSDLTRNKDEIWRLANIDLSHYYSYRSILESIHHYDIGQGKNYYYFHNPEVKRWQVVPWDVDLTWGDQMYGNGAEPFYRAGLLRHERFRVDYQARLAEIRDLLFNPEQTGALIDEYAAVISQPGQTRTVADADRAKWDYHPILSSRYAMGEKSRPGMFYQKSPGRDFQGMTQLMEAYIERRGQWIDRTLLGDAALPATPVIAPGNVDVSAPAIKLRLSPAPAAAGKVKWRLAEIGSPGKYEINPLWEAEGGAAAEIPSAKLKPGHTYRIRARVQDDNGRWSHWSAPQQVAPK